MIEGTGGEMLTAAEENKKTFKDVVDSIQALTRQTAK